MPDSNKASLWLASLNPIRKHSEMPSPLVTPFHTLFPLPEQPLPFSSAQVTPVNPGTPCRQQLPSEQATCPSHFGCYHQASPMDAIAHLSKLNKAGTVACLPRDVLCFVPSLACLYLLTEWIGRRELPKCHPGLRISNHCLWGARSRHKGRAFPGAPSRGAGPADLVSSCLVGCQRTAPQNNDRASKELRTEHGHFCPKLWDVVGTGGNQGRDSRRFHRVFHWHPLVSFQERVWRCCWERGTPAGTGCWRPSRGVAGSRSGGSGK